MYKLGDLEQMGGFVTRQLNLQGQTLSEIERRLGYHAGRLSQGAYFFVLEQLPESHQFDLAGYTQVAGHHTKEQYGSINDAADPMLNRKKELATAQWSKHGYNRLVKVKAVTGHDQSMKEDDQYPPGSGIQQWKVTAPLPFRVEAIVLDYPNGRFIPLQGFQEVKYR